MIGRSLNSDDLARILIRRACNGYYLRWWYNGWHYWFFLPGQITVSTEGEQYHTIGTRKVLMSSGQMNEEHCEGVRTIMNTREVYLLTDEGWKNIRIEPGSVKVYDRNTGGHEIVFTAIIGSRETSITRFGFTPVEDYATGEPDPMGIIIKTHADTFTMTLTGEGEVTIDWGDGTSTTIYLYPGEPQEVTHIYTDGVDSHTIVISNPAAIEALEAPGMEIYEIIIPDTATNLIYLDLSDNELTDIVIPDSIADQVYVDTSGNPIAACQVIIGRQIWDCAFYDSNFPGSRVFDDNEDNEAVYGRMYDWWMVVTPGFAPPGWRVPELADMEELFAAINAAVNQYGNSLTGGGILKEAGLDHWAAPNTGAVDTYDFSMLPGGYYSPSLGYLYLTYYAYTWVKDSYNDSYGYHYAMWWNSAAAYRGYLAKNNFASVRLLRNYYFSERVTDYDGNEYRVIRIGNLKWILSNLRVKHYADGTPIPEVTDTNDWKNGFVEYDDWFMPSREELQKMYDNLHALGLGNFQNANYHSSSEVNAANVHYISFVAGNQLMGSKNIQRYYRPCRTFVAGVGAYGLGDYGPAGGLIFYIDGAGTTYYEAALSDSEGFVIWSNIVAVLVGGTGTAIGTGAANTNLIVAQPGHTTSAAQDCLDYSVGGLIGGAMCFFNNDEATYGEIYGALYNWYAVDHASELAYFEKNGVEEEGWRVPSSADIEALCAALGQDPPPINNNMGGFVKEKGVLHWLSPNVGATNASQFTAVGAGSRSGSDGLFKGFKQTSYLWTTDAYQYTLSYLTDGMGRYGPGSQRYGVSVRCCRDI